MLLATLFVDADHPATLATSDQPDHRAILAPLPQRRCQTGNVRESPSLTLERVQAVRYI